MKKVILSLITLFIAFVILYDMKKGTLLTSSEPVLEKQEQDLGANESKTEESQDVEEPPYHLIEIEPGAKIISVAETLYDGPLPVSIEQLVADFKELNPDVAPETIQIGESYKFPNYSIKKSN